MNGRELEETQEFRTIRLPDTVRVLVVDDHPIVIEGLIGCSANSKTLPSVEEIEAFDPIPFASAAPSTSAGFGYRLRVGQEFTYHVTMTWSAKSELGSKTLVGLDYQRAELPSRTCAVAYHVRVEEEKRDGYLLTVRRRPLKDSSRTLTPLEVAWAVAPIGVSLGARGKISDIDFRALTLPALDPVDKNEVARCVQALFPLLPETGEEVDLQVLPWPGLLPWPVLPAVLRPFRGRGFVSHETRYSWATRSCILLRRGSSPSTDTQLGDETCRSSALVNRFEPVEFELDPASGLQIDSGPIVEWVHLARADLDNAGDVVSRRHVLGRSECRITLLRQ